MTKLIVLLLVLASVLVYANARHIHPHGDLQLRPHDVEEMWENDVENAEKREADDVEFANMVMEAPEDVRSLKPNRFVPLNNAVFFMGNQPCAQEGFKRDYLGVCREVWD